MTVAQSVTQEASDLRGARELLTPPGTWEDGFGLKAVLGALFVGAIMTPASMYMGLVMGAEIGSAAQWVTIILFIEVARRSFTTLSRPEIFVLHYMAGASLAVSSGLLWNQFIVQSESFRQLGLADKIPSWVAPSSPEVLGLRTFFHPAWVAPIGLVVLGLLLQRLDHFGLGYVMYRLTSDVEKLPFPLAPVTAEGVTALADASGGRETWRWRVFSFGTMLGLGFGAVYLALPTVSGALFDEPIGIFPLPFKDLTPNTETILPAVPVLLSFDLGLVLLGMVLPFWAMVGSFAGMVAAMALNPLLHRAGILGSWRPGIGAPATMNANYLDFYLSFGLGLTAAIALIGIGQVARQFLLARRATGSGASPDDRTAMQRLFNPPAGRGDFSIWIALGLYLASTALMLLAVYVLIGRAHQAGLGSPVTSRLMLVLLFYALVYTPVLGYVSARMEGIVGQSPAVPFVRETTLMMSGYQGVAIWFIPFPQYHYGSQALYFRATELSGTKISSLVKAEIVLFPIAVITTLVFSQFVWQMAPVPSSAFPWAQQWWEVTAFRNGVIYSSTLPGGAYGPFQEAFKPMYLLAGLGVAGVLYFGCGFIGLPVFFAYGAIRGLDTPAPAQVLPQFIGAMLARYWLAPRVGERWKPSVIVFFAGYSCGVGLIMMLSLGLVFITKSVFRSPF